MQKYALKIEYDGGPFCGWQRQLGLPTVQQAVENALGKLEQGLPSIIAAGRTDTGVHASGQVAHCEMARDWTPFRLSEALNYHLKPHPVAILAAAKVPPDFHARFSALKRSYEFRLLSRRAPAVLAKGRVWQVNQPLDLAAMQEAAAHLIGTFDFTTFRASQCQAASPIKTLDEITITARPVPGGTEFNLLIRARSFLHNQVRSIVGTLERVGAGVWQPGDVKTALAARNRSACGPVCPPQGLYLSDVTYRDDPFAG